MDFTLFIGEITIPDFRINTPINFIIDRFNVIRGEIHTGYGFLDDAAFHGPTTRNTKISHVPVKAHTLVSAIKRRTEQAARIGIRPKRFVVAVYLVGSGLFRIGLGPVFSTEDDETLQRVCVGVFPVELDESVTKFTI